MAGRSALGAPEAPGSDLRLVRAHAEVFLDAFRGEPDLADLNPTALRVLATAAALFHARGAAGTSVRDITRACDLSPGALYNHFPSRNDLLYTLVAHGHARLRRRVEAALAEAPPAPVDRFAAFVRAYVAGHLAHPTLAQVVRREYLHLDPPHYSQIVAQRRLMRDWLAGLLRAGADDGSLALIGGPDGATAQALMVLDMCSRVSEWFDPARAADSDAVRERYVAGALRLVGASP